MIQKKTDKITIYFSLVFFIILWYLIAFLIHSPLILPYPHEVLVRLVIISKTLQFWHAFLSTILRVICAFLISFLLGDILGLLSSNFRFVKKLLIFPFAVIRSTPLIAFILLALFWFKSGTVPIFVAVLMSLPVAYSSAENGFEKNTEIQEKIYKAASRGFIGFKAFFFIRFPSALPALLLDYAGK